MAGRLYELAEKLLRSYCPRRILAFMFRHGRAATACQLLFPAEGSSGAETAISGRSASTPVASRCEILAEGSPAPAPCRAGIAGLPANLEGA